MRAEAQSGVDAAEGTDEDHEPSGGVGCILEIDSSLRDQCGGGTDLVTRRGEASERVERGEKAGEHAVRRGHAIQAEIQE
jgi:hypothetical protein